MNKNLLLLALTASIAVNVSTFAMDKEDIKEDKPEAKKEVVALPEHAQEMLDKLTDAIEEKTKEIKDKDLKAQIAKTKEDIKNKTDKDSKANVEKETKALAEMEKEDATDALILNDLVASEKLAKNYFDITYNKSWMNKASAPMTKFAQWVAFNRKVALALEVTGVAGVAYVIYKSFFAQEEDEEETL